MPRPQVLVEFAHRLRQDGVPVSATCAGDLMVALEAVGASSSEDVYWAFRSLTVRSREQVPTFDQAFMDIFGRKASPLLIDVEEVVLKRVEIEGARVGWER